MANFHDDFIKLCEAYNVNAAYLNIVSIESSVNTKTSQLCKFLTGGSSYACEVLDAAISLMQREVGIKAGAMAKNTLN